MRTDGIRVGLLAAAASGLTLIMAITAAPASAATTPTISSLPFVAPTGASLDYPEGIAANNGTVDVSNTFDNVVASVTAAATTTLAGSYEAIGESGDGGPATAATLDSPAGLALDSRGDLFIADTEDNAVREITPDGTIHLIAGNGTGGYRGDGGPATRAELDLPQAVAVDGLGDVFIADTGNNVIREVNQRGDITTYAGTGTAGYRGDDGRARFAELSSPTGVTVDAFGNLYIADAGNNVIRRVSTSDQITTVAGNVALDQANGGLGGFSGDGGPATHAQLNSPQGVALDRAGDLYIADTFNNAIREVTPNGLITTIVNSAAKKGSAGDGGAATAAELNSPSAVSIDNVSGDLYIADTSNSRIRLVGLPVPGGPAPGPVAPGRPWS
jgi:hypothetical protein